MRQDFFQALAHGSCPRSITTCLVWCFFVITIVVTLSCPAGFSFADIWHIGRLFTDPSAQTPYERLISLGLYRTHPYCTLWYIHLINVLFLLLAIGLYQGLKSLTLTHPTDRFLFFSWLPAGCAVLLYQHLGPSLLVLCLSTVLLTEQTHNPTSRIWLIITTAAIIIIEQLQLNLLPGLFVLTSTESIATYQPSKKPLHYHIALPIIILVIYVLHQMMHPAPQTSNSVHSFCQALKMMSWTFFPLWLFWLNSLRYRSPENPIRFIGISISIVLFVLQTHHLLTALCCLWPYWCRASEIGCQQRDRSLNAFLSFFMSSAAICLMIMVWICWISLQMGCPAGASDIIQHLSSLPYPHQNAHILTALAICILWLISLYYSWRAQYTLAIIGLNMMASYSVVLVLAAPYLSSLNNYPALFSSIAQQVQANDHHCLYDQSLPTALRAIQFFTPLNIRQDPLCTSWPEMSATFSSHDNRHHHYLLWHLIHRHPILLRYR